MLSQLMKMSRHNIHKIIPASGQFWISTDNYGFEFIDYFLICDTDFRALSA